jgi:hypothetical protein
MGVDGTTAIVASEGSVAVGDQVVGVILTTFQLKKEVRRMDLRRRVHELGEIFRRPRRPVDTRDWRVNVIDETATGFCGGHVEIVSFTAAI